MKSDKPEQQHDPHVKEPVPQRVGTDNAERQDDWDQECSRDIDQPGDVSGGHDQEDEHENVRNEVRAHDRVDQGRVLSKELRARLQAVQNQGSQ